MYFFIWEALSNQGTAIVAERHFPKNPQLHINDNTYLSVSVVARAKISYYMCDHDFPWQISIGAIWKCCLCDKSWCNLHVPVRTGHLKLDKRLNMSHLFSHRHKSAIFIISLTADFCSSIHMHSVKQLTSDEGKRKDWCSWFCHFQTQLFSSGNMPRPDLTALWNGYKLDSLPSNHQSQTLNVFPFSPNICYQTSKTVDK